jgi:hypothetical protein
MLQSVLGFSQILIGLDTREPMLVHDKKFISSGAWTRNN